jgi:hypothetical protein
VLVARTEGILLVKLCISCLYSTQLSLALLDALAVSSCVLVIQCCEFIQTNYILRISYIRISELLLFSFVSGQFRATLPEFKLDLWYNKE